MTKGTYQKIQVENYNWYIKVINNKVEKLDFKQKEELLGSDPLAAFLAKELKSYLKGSLKIFETPINYQGTAFQKNCWSYLISIPYGEIRTYKDQAISIKNKNYVRAVAGANNKNPLPIIIPCHRVIGSNGSLVGYAGGLELKDRLIKLEK